MMMLVLLFSASTIFGTILYLTLATTALNVMAVGNENGKKGILYGKG